MMISSEDAAPADWAGTWFVGRHFGPCCHSFLFMWPFSLLLQLFMFLDFIGTLYDVVYEGVKASLTVPPINIIDVPVIEPFAVNLS